MNKKKKFPKTVEFNGITYTKREVEKFLSKHLNFDKRMKCEDIGRYLFANGDYPEHTPRLSLVNDLLFTLLGLGKKISKIRPKKKSPRVEVDIDKVFYLMDLGDEYAKNNFENHNNKYVQKMRMVLDSIGFHFTEEKKVIIENNTVHGTPKLYLLDFYIHPPLNFVIEVDGAYHDQDAQKFYDKKRDQQIAGKGLGPTFRIKNEQVMRSDFDLLKILGKNAAIKKRILKFYPRMYEPHNPH